MAIILPFAAPLCQRVLRRIRRVSSPSREGRLERTLLEAATGAALRALDATEAAGEGDLAGHRAAIQAYLQAEALWEVMAAAEVRCFEGVSAGWLLEALRGFRLGHEAQGVGAQVEGEV